MESPSGLHGYLKDNCPKDPEQAKVLGCSCVALIHGMGDSALTWSEILLWSDEQWKQMGLKSPIKLYAMDLPGSGKSSPPENLSEYRVRMQAQRLQQDLASLCSSWVLVGNSLGGWISAWLGLDWPEGVNRLVLLAPAGLKTGQSWEDDAKNFFGNPTIESTKEFQKRAYFHPKKVPPHAWREIVLKAKQSNTKKVWDAQIEEDALNLRLTTLRRPTLFIWGEEDKIIPISAGKQMRSLMPTAIWREVSQCGHLPQRECPAAVARGIVDMINMGGM